MDILGNGLGPVLEGPGASSAVAFPMESYETPVLDLTQVTLGIELFPAKPGHFPVIQTASWVIISASGTQTTPLTARAGSDAGHVNTLSTSTAPSNTDVNGANPPSISLTVGVITGVTKIPNGPVIMDITAGAQGTGGFTLTGKLVCAAYWVAEG